VLELDTTWHQRLTRGSGNATLRTMLDDLRRDDIDRAAVLLEQNWRKGLHFIAEWLERRERVGGGAK
jgi:hypothetical protein